MDRDTEERGFLTSKQIEYLEGGEAKHERQTRRRIRKRLRGAMWDFGLLAEHMPIEERRDALENPRKNMSQAIASTFQVLWTGLGEMQYRYCEQRGTAAGERDLGRDDVVGMEIEYKPVLRSEVQPASFYQRAVTKDSGEVLELAEFVRQLQSDKLSEDQVEIVEIDGVEDMSEEEVAEAARQIAKSRQSESRGDGETARDSQ